MTNEEAYNRIDAIISKHEIDDVYVTITNFKDYDALRIARKTLEQQPTAKENLVVEDCISRAELLKAVDTWDKFGCDADTKLVPVKDCYVPYIHYDDVVKAIKGMPSVQPKTGWIPVSERLPESHEIECLVVDDKGEFGVGFYREDAKAWDSWNWGWLERKKYSEMSSNSDTCIPCGIDDVIAWQPLPEPYKAESEE